MSLLPIGSEHPVHDDLSTSVTPPYPAYPSSPIASHHTTLLVTIMEHQLVTPVPLAPAAVPSPITPVPMSFPALLVNPKSRVAQLRTGKEVRGPVKPIGITGKGQGKRWIRRAENSTSFSALHTPSSHS